MPFRESGLGETIFFKKKKKKNNPQILSKDLEARCSNSNHRNCDDRPIFFVLVRAFIRDVNLHKSAAIRPAVGGRASNRESNGSIRERRLTG